MSDLAMLYASRIIKGPQFKVYKDVPKLLKPYVKKILTDEGFEDLVID